MLIGGRIERQDKGSAAVGRDRTDGGTVVDQVAAFSQRAQQAGFAKYVVAVGTAIANQRQCCAIEPVKTGVDFGIE